MRPRLSGAMSVYRITIALGKVRNFALRNLHAN